MSPAGSYLKKLVDERRKYENSLNSGAEYVTATRSGVVSYKVDGLEEMLNTKDFGKMTKEFLVRFKFENRSSCYTSEESGKIIDNYECYIASDFRFGKCKKCRSWTKIKASLPVGSEVPAEIEYINSQDGR